MTPRAAERQEFLRRAGWANASCSDLAGDASTRSFFRLSRPAGTAVLMDTPQDSPDDPAAFCRIAAHLSALGLSAPRILAQDLPARLLLLEDLGDAIFAREVARDPACEAPLYAEAAGVLAHLQAAPAPPGLPDLTAADWAEATGLVLDWYLFAATGARSPAPDYFAALAEALARHADGPRVLILRDYFGENLLWLPQRSGLARVGLLDFQLGQMGQPGYDLVSLLQDARRDVGKEATTAAYRRYLDESGRSEAVLAPSLAVLGAQRALRILGIFARLCLVQGKTAYLAHLPRVWRQLQENLSHPALAPLRAVVTPLLPPPEPALLQRIAAQCARFR